MDEVGLSILALWWTAAALAGRVDVEDGSGCLEAQALRDALVPVLGSALQRIDIDVFVEAKGDSRALHVTVDVGAHRWLETLEIDARECLYAPTAVALGIQRGLAGLPGFNWKKLERDPTLYRLGGSLGGSGPIAPRVLVAGRASVGRVRPYRC